MTINVVNMEMLTDTLLRNEQRDLCHVISFVVNHVDCKTTDSETYVIGKGHMTFFRNKLLWVLSRLETVSIEMLDRGLITEERCEEIIDHYNELLSDNYDRLTEEGLLKNWVVSTSSMMTCVASLPPVSPKPSVLQGAKVVVIAEQPVVPEPVPSPPVQLVPDKPTFMTNWNAFIGGAS